MAAKVVLLPRLLCLERMMAVLSEFVELLLPI